MEPVPASASPPPAAPEPRLKLSKLILYVMLAIAVVVIAAIFGFILVYVAGLTHQLWWMGLTSLIFALIWYMVYMGSHNRTIAFPLSAAFFVIGIGSFYGSIASDPVSDPLNKLILMVIESIFVVIVLTAIWTMSRQSEEDKVRKSQRKVTP
ncbi:MAG TPA: hypothetical protein VEY12_10040 [Thermoplasmata archaeon]|nr:hypothetical protein [Thermoplasmata archaeon]